MDELTMQVDLVPWQLASGVGPCVVIVESFKHVPRVTAHPQMLALELRAPMDTCSGNRKHTQQVVTINWEKFGVKIFLLVLLTKLKFTKNFQQCKFIGTKITCDVHTETAVSNCS